MRDRTLIGTLTGLLLLGLLLPACPVTPATEEALGDFPAPVVKGATWLDEKVELAGIHWPEEGDREGRFVVKNVSGKTLRYLCATAVFYFDPDSGDSVARTAAESFQTIFNIYKDEEVTIQHTPERTRPVRSVGLMVEELERRTTRERSADRAGSTFLDGRLECVEMEDHITLEEPFLQFTLENRSREKLTGVRYRVLLIKEGEVAWESARWMPVPGGVAPGERKTLEPDLSGWDQGMADVILLVKQQF